MWQHVSSMHAYSGKQEALCSAEAATQPIGGWLADWLLGLLASLVHGKQLL